MNPMSVYASIPSPPADFSSFSLGPLTIHAYALCILAGILLALWMTSVRWKRRGLPEDAVWDISIWAIPFGIIGGRLYHVVSSPDAYFGPDGDLSLIPQIWLGGLGIWGAVALGAVGAWIGCRRAGIKLSTFADVGAPGLLLAQAVGRWGNWFNQELFGSETDAPWGLEIDADNANFPDGAAPGTTFHPTFLYESLWNLAGVALLLLLDRRFRLRGGRLFWIYAAFYTAGRLWIELLRIDDAEMVTLLGVTQRLNVWTSLLILVASIAMFIYLTFKARKGGEGSLYLPGHEPAPQGGIPAADNEKETEARNAESASAERPVRANLAETKTEESLPHRSKDNGPSA
ncbi:prolipoprotein diacylglyceryl transferase [Arthrobacter sp. zg-Y1171]|uniref:prolipoprotein diacylglyceryl transferase n=1 Tax=Arthrobacter sp. zg-Y1171 TaxID=2964610 RepID=UPI0021074BA3|nr:prolipoprotein diacylglyceryl transferase [Arthrobacter sp. zg-Y1171]MCQ1995704.1 prolipoprotein diacylglyceryl transferase [Arthrobacter sp. zg-Y1171]UWX83211.1 prolipoprotein diacylglyceryl transferase [Arthrobacter sp. zg-Y1171]